MKKRMKSRAYILCFVFLMGAAVSIFRILYIQNSDYRSVADAQFNKSIVLGETRGYIYDRNLQPLVNTSQTEKVVLQVNKLTNRFVSDTVEFDEIKQGMLISADTNFSEEENAYIKRFKEITRYDDSLLCRHVIGYVDSDSNGVSGIEKAFDRILKEASGELRVSFKTTAGGNVLAGDGIELVNSAYNSPAGVSLTIDKRIQEVTETAMDNSDIECGAAVVMDVETFEIAAICSVPEFDIFNIASSLENDKLPFLNRSLSSFPAGSVFKPFVAAAALENGWSITEVFDCKGYLNVGNNVFRCYNSNIHGLTDLNNAVEKSCNTFFVNLGLSVGAEKIIETAEAFGFGKSIEFCSTLSSDSGNIPSAEAVTSSAQLANLCFGQGDILITPVQLAAAYSVLANGGTYKEPTLLKDLIDGEGKVYASYRTEICYEAVSKDTCDIINTALYNNMLNGTGIKGASLNVSSAGKTATAQTGRYDENGEEILCTWFAGFFPYDEPHYAVVILNENGSTASVDCAPVFKNIIEGISSLETDG